MYDWDIKDIHCIVCKDCAYWAHTQFYSLIYSMSMLRHEMLVTMAMKNNWITSHLFSFFHIFLLISSNILCLSLTCEYFHQRCSSETLVRFFFIDFNSTIDLSIYRLSFGLKLSIFNMNIFLINCYRIILFISLFFYKTFL